MPIVLAAHHDKNAGMLSANLALAQILGDRADRSVFLNLASDKDAYGGVLRYRNFQRSPEALYAGQIVGWGDFIHAMSWAENGLSMKLAKTVGLTKAETIDAWYRLYMLEGIETKEPVSFGSTLYTNRLQDYADTRYAAALRAWAGQASLFAFRDPASVAQLKTVMDMKVELALDCAFLLDSDAVIATAPSPDLTPKSYIVESFGRSGMAAEQRALVRTLARKKHLSVVTLPWLQMTDEAAFPSWLAVLRGAAFCVTDIYHLSVNALRDGVPVLCTMRPGSGDRPVDDEKKRLLFQSLGLCDRLVDLTTLSLVPNGPVGSETVDSLLARLDSIEAAAVQATLQGPVTRWCSRLREVLDL